MGLCAYSLLYSLIATSIRHCSLYPPTYPALLRACTTRRRYALSPYPNTLLTCAPRSPCRAPRNAGASAVPCACAAPKVHPRRRQCTARGADRAAASCNVAPSGYTARIPSASLCTEPRPPFVANPDVAFARRHRSRSLLPKLDHTTGPALLRSPLVPTRSAQIPPTRWNSALTPSFASSRCCCLLATWRLRPHPSRRVPSCLQPHRSAALGAGKRIKSESRPAKTKLGFEFRACGRVLPRCGE
ncbi:hypothetical protein C8R43DRAFT_530683 [Mycena crocata]|nr:hypothetical protein C8R43DRAFT_530683 [Mycena crocata]